MAGVLEELKYEQQHPPKGSTQERHMRERAEKMRTEPKMGPDIYK